MKNFLIGIAILAIAILGTFLYITKVADYVKLSENEVILPANTMNTIDSLLALPPTIKHDTKYVDTGSVHIVYKDIPLVEPDPLDSTIHFIRDSLSTSTFTVWHTITFFDLGYILNNEWKYKEFGPTEIITTITDYVPKPVPYEVKVPSKGLFLGINGGVSGPMQWVGFNADYQTGRFMFGGSVNRYFGFDKYVVGVGFRASYKLRK